MKEKNRKLIEKKENSVEYKINEEVNCFWADKKRTLAYFRIVDSIIELEQKIFLPDILGGKLFAKIFKLKEKYPKTKIRFDQVISVKKTRFRLNKNAFLFILSDDTQYIVVFDYPKSMYFKLLELLPNTSFVNFDSFIKNKN